jgi:hypothetical protein
MMTAAHVTNEEWRTFWLAKVNDEVERLNLSQALSRFHYACEYIGNRQNQKSIGPSEPSHSILKWKV